MSLSDEVRHGAEVSDDAWLEEIADRIAELEAENKRLRAVLQDIADDPVISEPMGMKRGVSHILAIAREGLAN